MNKRYIAPNTPVYAGETVYFVKSVYSEQIYALNFMPEGEGWERVTEDEYYAYCKKMGLV